MPESAVEATLAAFGRIKVHDVSPTISSSMDMWFGHGAPEITAASTHATGPAASNLLKLSEHTGSHVDAPFHFDPDGRSIEQFGIETLMLRPYRKYDLSSERLEPGEVVGLERLAAAAERAAFTLQPGQVAIIDFGWDRHRAGGEAGREAGWWGRNAPGLSLEACEYLADAGVCAVACDTAACDIAIKDGVIESALGHTDIFLPQGVLIVEGLKGLGAAAASGLFLALPLGIEGGTASPIRVALLTD